MSIKEKIAELGIEEDKANALSELFESAISPLKDEVTKLTQVKENLLQDKIKWKEQNDSALSEAEKIKNEALKQAGDWETLEANLKASHQSELDKYKEQIAGRDKMILGKQTEAVINELANQFVDPNVGKMMLKNMVTTNYSESGDVVTSLNGLDGQSLATDAATFADKLKGIDGFSSVLKGVDSSGGGAQGGSGSGAAGGKMTLTEMAMKANSDPNFAQQFNKG
jgi:hypothetical protein